MIVATALGAGVGAGLAATDQHPAAIMQVAGVVGASIAGGMNIWYGSADASFSKIFGTTALGYATGMAGALAVALVRYALM